MNNPKTKSHGIAASWDTYWEGIGRIGAYSIGGVKHPAIKTFWNDFFQEVKFRYQKPEILDMASGDGSVMERAIEVFGGIDFAFTCVDRSEAAVANIRARFSRARGVVADACFVPLESESFDVITSQFGVEYAGPDALNEATRLLAKGGRLGLLLHNQSGSIYQECKAGLDAIGRLQESEFINRAIDLFRTGFLASQGGNRAAYDEAAKRLAPAVQALESIMDDYGRHVAGDTIIQLYGGVDRIHQNLQRYQPDEVIDWLKAIDDELDAFTERMSSMCACAIDDETFERICTGLTMQGYTLLRSERFMALNDDLPLAWILIAEKVQQPTEPAPTGELSPDREKSEFSRVDGEEKLRAWTRKQIETAVETLTSRQLFRGFLVEAKPAWVLPFQILIGKVREKGQEKTFHWFICGETTIDHVHANAASSPREVARYFALKWQRDAMLGAGGTTENSTGSLADPGGRTVRLSLAEQAEALYELADDPRVWPRNTDD